MNTYQINFPQYLDPNGALCVYQGEKDVPFGIRRIFNVTALRGDIRGNHAHKKCTQLLVCTAGEIKVSCDDGFTSIDYLLKSMSVGLLIPPMVWAKEEYLHDGAVLMVLCDLEYEDCLLYTSPSPRD